ncbi:hypothetical protein [Rhodococcus koreensis]
MTLQATFDAHRKSNVQLWQRLYDVMGTPMTEKSKVEIIESVRGTIERLKRRVTELESRTIGSPVVGTIPEGWPDLETARYGDFDQVDWEMRFLSRLTQLLTLRPFDAGVYEVEKLEWAESWMTLIVRVWFREESCLMGWQQHLPTLRRAFTPDDASAVANASGTLASSDPVTFLSRTSPNQTASIGMGVGADLRAERTSS